MAVLINNYTTLLSSPLTRSHDYRRTSYGMRASQATNPVAQKLYRIIEKKQSNLALSADVTTKEELLLLADLLGPEICILKVHIDIIVDFDWDLIVQLQSLAQKHQFLLCEDRKFADIGNTVLHQYTGGIYKIVEWADIIIAHAIFGASMVASLRASTCGKERALLLVVQASSADNLINATYSQSAIEIAQCYKDFVIGFICQEQCTFDNQFVHCTPGINGLVAHDFQGQHYTCPDVAIKQKGTDIIIVGRGIYQAPDPLAAARAYRQVGWQAYVESKLSVDID